MGIVRGSDYDGNDTKQYGNVLEMISAPREYKFNNFFISQFIRYTFEWKSDNGREQLRDNKMSQLGDKFVWIRKLDIESFINFIFSVILSHIELAKQEPFSV